MADRILLVTPAAPWDKPSGMQQRTSLLYQALLTHIGVDILILEEGLKNEELPVDNRDDLVGRLRWRPNPILPYKYSPHRWVNKWCRSHLDLSRYAAIVGRYLTPISQLSTPARIPRIVDCDDAFYSYVPQSNSIIHKWIAWGKDHTRTLQTSIALRRFDHVLFCSKSDQRAYPRISSTVLPNISSIRPQTSTEQSDSNCALIVGSMWYRPNQEGVDWFLNNCWREILAQTPTLRLRVIGACPPEQRAKWGSFPNVDAPGFVENIDSEYRRCLFTLAPIRYGGGTCIKLLESAAFERACITTEHVFAGYADYFERDREILVASDAAAMIQHCTTLARSADLRAGIASRAREINRRHFNPQVFNAAVAHALRKVALI